MKVLIWGFPGGTSGKEPPANAGDVGDVGSIPGSGRSPGGERGNSLQYSCLESPMERGPLQAAVHRVAQNQTQLKQLRSQASNSLFYQFSDVHFKVFWFSSIAQSHPTL